MGELVAAIQQGQQISEEDLTNLQNIVTFLNGLDVTGTGQHIKEGVAQGMTEAGWATDAETVAANLEAALNSALGIQSPSTRMKPTGSNVAAGVGAGMANTTSPARRPRWPGGSAALCPPPCPHRCFAPPGSMPCAA